MALFYLSKNHMQVSNCIAQWLLLFMEFDILVVYELGKSHTIVDVLS
jgi:hypothetical protein